MSTKTFSSAIMSRLRERFRRLYGESGDQCLERLAMMVGRYGVGVDGLEVPIRGWSQKDAVLITYGDTLQCPEERPLKALRRFLKKRLKGLVNAVHILPFFPYSSDDGFSVTNYRHVNPELGTWDEIQVIADDFRLMVDLVLNHVSRKNSWFEDYTNGISPARHYFLDVEPGTDLSQVVRPRALPLLSPARTPGGERYVWTTFSADQIDLNFRNPDVLFEFLDILLLYISKGARTLRLNATGDLWKEIGTPCVHLPETHEVVKIIRDVCAMVAPDVLILTETNVPHEENVSYFGDGDEAHLVYQYTLPPLLLHALEHEDTKYLRAWASSLQPPPPGCTFLNITATHNGIGVRALEGIVPAEDVEELAACVRRRGGYVSTRLNADGEESTYELNITYYSALADPDQLNTELHVARFLCSQAVAMSLKGIPAVYFHSLVAGENDREAVERTGRVRSINRSTFDRRDLETDLRSKASVRGRVFREYTKLLRLRSRQTAFHPEGSQRILDLGNKVFACERTSPDGEETILALSNFTARSVSVTLDGSAGAVGSAAAWRELIRGRSSNSTRKRISLGPYQTAWLLAK